MSIKQACCRIGARHGRGAVNATDDDIIKALNAPVFGGSSHLNQLKEAGTDMQIISPRPYQMMHSESPKLVTWYTEESNTIIARQTKLFPKTFRGVCGLPQSPGVAIKEVLPYLEKCVKEDGFVGRLINPDPGEGSGHQTPPLGDRYWYPLYEKLCELDIVGPCSLCRMPVRTADVFAALHQRRKHCGCFAADIIGL